MSKHICKFLFCFVLVFITGCSGFSDEPESSSAKSPSGLVPVTGEHLYGVASYGTNNVWVVGFESTVFHTSNAGTDWEKQQIPLMTDLYDVSFVDQNNGWISGKGGTILHTADGGKTWRQQQSGTEERLLAVQFIDKDTGWAVGTMSTILHTRDGGNNWVKKGGGEDRYLNDVCFVDRKNGWVVGEYGFIAHTVDGGGTWQVQECKDIIPPEPKNDFRPPLPHLYGVFFSDASKGWITGMDGIIARTVDGGETWRKLDTGTMRPIFSITVRGDKGWAVGDRGQLLLSSDGGTIWTLRKDIMKTRFWMRDLDFNNAGQGWIVGAFGAILRTDDSGKTWKQLSGILF